MINKLNKKWLAAGIILLIAVVLTAIIPAVAKHKVVFYSADNSVMLIDEVGRKNAATPPVEPQMPEGLIFTSWDKDISSVRKDMDVHPICKDIKDIDNAFALAGAYGKPRENVIVPFVLSGNVCICGFDLTVRYDSEVLQLESVFDEDGAILYNADVPGEIRINYVSLGNTTGGVDLCKFKFTVIGEADETEIKTEMVSIYSENEDLSLSKADFELVDSTVYIIG